jgi:hypothetical protein
MTINNENFQKAFEQFSQPEKDIKDDCERICRVAKEAFEIDMTPAQAYLLWQDKSDTYCAGWLCITSNDEIKETIETFVERIEEA